MPPNTLRFELKTFCRDALVWVLVLAGGLALLRGRFDFGAEQELFSWRSYLSSSFFFVLTLPTTYYLLAAAPLRRGVRLGLTTLLFVVLTLPWVSLKLERSVVEMSFWEAPQPEPVPTFFPRAWFDEGFPHDKAFFLVLVVTFAALAIALVYRGLTIRAGSLAHAARATAPSILAYAAICLQTWAHTSMRSGYSLNAYLFAAPEHQNWYVLFLYPEGGGRGAVSADLPYWWGLDYYFQGVPWLPPTMLLRRAFVPYLGSNLGYLVHPYLAYLALNTLLWFGAVAAFHRFTLTMTGRRDLARYAAALVCVGNGFVYFVGQPFAYLGGFCCAALVPWVYVQFLSKNDALSRLRVVPVAMGFALCALTYDIFPVLLAMVGLSLLCRAGTLRSLAAMALALGFYCAFLHLQFTVLGLTEDPSNELAITTAKNGLLELVQHPLPGKIYQLSVTFLPKLLQSLGYAFQLVAVALAVAGVWSARRRKTTRIFVLLLSPALLAGAFFHYGQATFDFSNSQWGEIPMIELARISYVAFPAIYFGAALGLARLRQWFATSWFAAGAGAAIWIFIVALGLWQNADAFGFVTPAFHFYHPVHGPWLDAR